MSFLRGSNSLGSDLTREEGLALVVVPKREPALLGQGELAREIAHRLDDLADQTLEVCAGTIGQFLQVGILQSQKGGEHRNRRHRRRTVITIAYGGVDARHGLLLDALQYRKQAAKPVRHVGMFHVQALLEVT